MLVVVGVVVVVVVAMVILLVALAVAATTGQLRTHHISAPRPSKGAVGFAPHDEEDISTTCEVGLGFKIRDLKSEQPAHPKRGPPSCNKCQGLDSQSLCQCETQTHKFKPFLLLKLSTL